MGMIWIRSMAPVSGWILKHVNANTTSIAPKFVETLMLVVLSAISGAITIETKSCHRLNSRYNRNAPIVMQVKSPSQAPQGGREPILAPSSPSMNRG